MKNLQKKNQFACIQLSKKRMLFSYVNEHLSLEDRDTKPELTHSHSRDKIYLGSPDWP